MPRIQAHPQRRSRPTGSAESSPATRTYDTTEKRDIYAAHGVEYLWFIDPEARTLEAFALRDAAWLLLANLHDDAAVRVAPFEATSFPLSDLWPD